jgi:hypothetical protein
MKKAILTALMVAFMAFPCLAFDGSTASGRLDASAQVVGGVAYLTALTVLTDGTNAATVTLYDSTAASGKIIAKLWVPGAVYSDRMTWVFPVRANVGIYASISGTGANAIVEYIKK